MPTTQSLQEVLLAIHFVDRLPLSIVDYASFIERFGGTGALVQNLAPLPPIQFPIAGQNAFQVAFQAIEAAAVPRIRVTGSSGKFFVLQEDRVAFGWERGKQIGLDANYPGYDQLLKEWCSDTIEFENWLALRVGVQFSSRALELDYNNFFPVERNGEKLRLRDIVRFELPTRNPVRAFQINWDEPVGDEGGVVSVQCGLGSAPPGIPGLVFNFFSLLPFRAPPGRSLSVALAEPADSLHRRILDIYNASVISQEP